MTPAIKVLWGILAIVGSLGVALGCGQDVATCASVAGLPGNATGFAARCGLMQDVCSTGNGAADLQAYLTCLGNAGTLDAITGPCNALYTLVNRECLDTGGVGAGRSGTGGGSGTTPVETATCATLGVCCGSVPSVTVDSCNSIAAAEVQSSCAITLSEIEAAGYCTGGSGTAIGTSSVVTSVSVSAGNCAVGAACTQGEDCGLAGQGPCSSDVTLACDTDGVFVVSGFPCDQQSGSCGFGTGDCSESCTCTNGQMICTGNCPDAGL